MVYAFIIELPLPLIQLRLIFPYVFDMSQVFGGLVGMHIIYVLYDGQTQEFFSEKKNQPKSFHSSSALESCVIPLSGCNLYIGELALRPNISALMLEHF